MNIPEAQRSAERMLNLLALLSESTRPLSLDEIMVAIGNQYPANAEARRTTFERDKRTLREMGVPIEHRTLGGTDAGKAAYYINSRGASTISLEPDELQALQEAAAMVQIGTNWGRHAVLRLGGEVPDGAPAERVFLSSEFEALPELFDAIRHRKIAEFTYHGKKRKVEPLGLFSRDGYWYLSARETGSDVVKNFRVDRVDGEISVGKTDGVFERPADYDVAASMASDAKLFDGDTERAIVRVSRSVAPQVIRELGESAIVHVHEAGDIDVSVPCGNRTAFRTWLFAMVDRAEVVEPASLRGEVVAWLRDIAETRA